MTQDELIDLLHAHEWRDVEFKEARRAVPKTAYETVAAFANTEGGHLVFGVRESEGAVEPVGVLDVDKVQGEFLMDAATDRYDGQPVECDAATAFDEESVRWYRAVYEAKPGNRSHAGLPDMDFLAQMGLLAGQGDNRKPTRAAVLLFGTNPVLRQVLPRPVVDCQRYRADRGEADTGERWFDRLVLEDNLVRTWRALIGDWYERFAEHPFRVDPETLQRDDTPPDYQAFRESMVNLIVHQDYADQSRKAVIRRYADQTVFWNPGDAFADDADLLGPGEKEVRNPRIVFAFRHIGLGENAGWGLRDVFRSWQQLGNVPPRIGNDKHRKSFELVLDDEKLMSESQLAFQRGLGVTLTEEQGRTLALACREDFVTPSRIELAVGVTGAVCFGAGRALGRPISLASSRTGPVRAGEAPAGAGIPSWSGGLCLSSRRHAGGLQGVGH